METSSENAVQRVADLERQIRELKEKLTAARRRLPGEEVEDYLLAGQTGPMRLSELFGDKRDLLLVHNMGKSCRYCTLWADGLNGLVSHLESRAAFVVATPDAPEVQAEFAGDRGWRFRMVSQSGTSLAEDLGFRSGNSWLPGVSALKRDESGAIVRTGKAAFGPGDDFCAVWPLFDLLDGGAGDWSPRYSY